MSVLSIADPATEHAATTVSWPLPAVAVATVHAAGSGVHDPAAWAAHLAALHRCGDGSPITARTMIADPTLAGLPAALAAWGRERIAVAAHVRLPHPDAGDAQVLLVAPTRAAYARLCRYLSLAAEHPAHVATWLTDGATWGYRFRGPDLHGLVALVRDRLLGEALEAVGAEVRWRCHDTPDDDRAEGRWPALWLPILTLVSASERQQEPIRAALARLAGIEPCPGLALDELPQVAARFHDRPELILASHELAAGCAGGVPEQRLHLPPSDHHDADRELAARALAGAGRRYGAPLPDAVVDRLVHELAVIRRKGFSGYILTVADLAAGRRTCGRGSGASSLVVYCLGITNVDPIRYRLLFERFLSHARTDPPDLDVDFPWDERDAVFRYALERYGADHVAMVATHQRLGAKGALRAVARAWGMDPAATTTVAGRLRAQRRYGTPAQLNRSWQDLLCDAAAVEGMHLHDGLHCGGLVITGPPIRDLVPVHRAAKELLDDSQAPGTGETVPAIAWEKDGAEAMGLVKIDLLGNRSLAVLRDCLHDLAAWGQAIDEAGWRPDHDPATCALVASGDTMGCFYIESPAMRTLQAKAGSGDIDRLVVHSSIIRPAANRWINEYLRRLHHVRRCGCHDPGWYLHPALRDLLSESFGILSYQEDVMIAAREVAGFDEQGANGLRKALGHWDSNERLLGFRDRFLAGCAERGVAPTVAGTIWDMIASFSGYSFAKAHSASYAVLSFQCAYLKAHHPAVFLARVVANEGGFYRPMAYIEDARRRGVAIRGPSVVHGVWPTIAESPRQLRLGLHLVPLVSPAIAGRILGERAVAPFTGIGDLARRAAVPGRVLASLAACGALDDLRPDLTPPQIRWLAHTIALQAVLRQRKTGRAEIPGTQWIFPAPAWCDPAVPELPCPPPAVIAWERYQALGICVAAHPITFAERPPGDPRAVDVARLRHGQEVSLGGLVTTRKQVTANAGGRRSPMAFVTLEDETGVVETVWFPAAYRRHGQLLDLAAPLRITGTVEFQYGVPTVTVLTAAPLPVPVME